MGILYIVPTPIGNLQDITLRGMEVLFTVPFIACEDTRKTGQLLKLLKEKYGSVISCLVQGRDESIQQQLISYYEQNERLRIPNLLNVLQNGFDVALVSDAGAPLISDPGFRLVQACDEQNIKVVSLPGASSVITALAASGLPPDKFTFIGYPPHKPGHRKTLYENIQKSAMIISSTFILFEAPHKLKKTLEEMQAVFGDIDIVITRELTKMHEEVKRGKISDMLKFYTKSMPKGEFVLLFHQ